MQGIKNIKSLSTILIWYVFTIYLQLRIITSNYRFSEEHQINLLLLWLATVSYFLGNIKGNLFTLLMLIIGFFANASFTIIIHTLSFGLRVSLTYLPMIVYFIIINRNELFSWIVEEFNSKDSSDILDKS